ARARRLSATRRQRITTTSSFFFFQAEDGIRDRTVTGVQTCALPISIPRPLIPSDCAGRSPSTGAGRWRDARLHRDAGSGSSFLGGRQDQGRRGGVLDCDPDRLVDRSEERRVGKEGRARGGRCDGKKK